MVKEKERLHGLDHLRSAAIVLVLLFHYKVYYGVPGWMDTFCSFGWSGVDLFFVLSGYLIATKIFHKHDKTGRIDFRGFYWNRCMRIIPAYLVVVAFYFSFSPLREGRGLQPLWKFVTFTQNISIDMFPNTFSHAWSLCVEEHFYLLLPVLLYFIFSRKLTRHTIFFMAAIAVLGMILRYLVWELWVESSFGREKLILALKHIYYPTYTRLDGLLTGVTIAVLFKYRPSFMERMTKYGNILAVLSFILLIATYVLFDGSVLSMRFTTLGTALFGFPLVSLAYGLMVVAALSPGSLLYRVKFRPSRMLATISYAIYLTHKIINHVMNTTFRSVFKVENYQIFVASLFAAVLGGWVLYIVVEKPFLILRDRRERI